MKLLQDLSLEDEGLPANELRRMDRPRAQVCQALVHAEQDGELAYLDTVLYSHN
jgi:hypothetical protein